MIKINEILALFIVLFTIKTADYGYFATNY